MASILRGIDNFDTTDFKNYVSVPTYYHIYNGSVTANNTIVTNGFSTTLHTGNGTTQDIISNVDMSTQWGNDVSETFGGLVWLKSRSAATNNFLFDTIRGVTKEINSNTTEAEATLASSLTAFNNNGVSVGANIAGVSTTSATYVSWNFQTTHIKTGVTNQGKAYTEHYNPFTGFTIIKYTGSGLAGHEIPHSLGRKLGFVTIKNLSAVADWYTITSIISKGGFLNLTNAFDNNSAYPISNTATLISMLDGANSPQTNTVANDYIMYGWANSYYDSKNTLIGNYEIGVYQGTGANGNNVITRGKPSWVMVKRLDSTSNWVIIDNQRTGDKGVYPNLSNAESSTWSITFNIDGFIIGNTATETNASGGQYLYMVVYDNDSGSGKSKYPKATDTTNLSINALVPYSSGIDTKGEKVSISYKNETITGLTYTQGKNYPYSKNDGTYSVNKYLPMYGALRDRIIAGENPDYFDLDLMKWYGTSGGSELVTNGSGTSLTGWQGVSFNSTLVSSDSSVLTLSNNTFVLTNATSKIYAGMQQQLNGLTIGRKYKLLLDLDSIIGILVSIREMSVIGLPGYINSIESKHYSTLGKQYLEFTATATTLYLLISINNSSVGVSTQIDNISTFETVPTIDAEITPRTYLDCIAYADQNGQVEYVEELPKIEYKNIIRANEYQGENACTAWFYLGGYTIPPTIRDSFNISSIIRISQGTWRVYFKTPMNNTNYSFVGSSQTSTFICSLNNQQLTFFDFSVRHPEGASYYDASNISIQVFGGKN